MLEFDFRVGEYDEYYCTELTYSNIYFSDEIWEIDTNSYPRRISKEEALQRLHNENN